jgi:hypothetical protein
MDVLLWMLIEIYSKEKFLNSLAIMKTPAGLQDKAATLYIFSTDHIAGNDPSVLYSGIDNS